MKQLKVTTNVPGVFVIATGLLLASAVSAKDFNVDLRVESTPPQLVATSRGNCGNNNHDGCVQSDKNKSADINFNLKGDKKCDLAEGADWSLTSVYLGGKGSSSKPASMGGLDGAVQADFDVADAGTGLLKHQKGSNPQHIRIDNRNKSAYSIWYTVEASCVDKDGKVHGTLKLDPRIKNTGGDD